MEAGKTDAQKTVRGRKKRERKTLTDHYSKGLIPSNELLVPSGRTKAEEENASVTVLTAPLC